MRYGFLFELKKDDYKSWAKGLQSSGYATSKTYSEKLISLIERYELYKLDHLTLKSSEITELEAQKILAWQNISIQDSTNLEHKIDTNQFHKLDTFNAAPAFPLHQLSLWEKWHNNSTDKSINSLQIFVVNGSKTVILQQGQTLNALAQQLKIKKSKLIKYNELQKNQLQSFQHLFIEPKSKKYTGQTSSHKVVFHENLYDISQLYGIKLKNLQQLNTAFRKRKISEGDNIKLKK